MRDAPHLDFSYSGLKTAVLYALRDDPGAKERLADLAASFQEAAVDALLAKTRQAMRQTGARRLVLAGGVAANRRLRERLLADIDGDVFLPPFAYCLDNGAMIAAAADSRLEHGFTDPLTITPDAALPL